MVRIIHIKHENPFFDGFAPLFYLLYSETQLHIAVASRKELYYSYKCCCTKHSTSSSIDIPYAYSEKIYSTFQFY